MRMQLLKIVVILLVAGSGDTRPHNGADSQAKTIERNDAGWRSIQVSSKSHDIVRDDSRYTGTSGSNRKYITHFRDNADSSREHGAVNSRASNFGAARSLSVRRSKIDDIWTMPKFKAINAPPYFSRTDVLGDIAKIATVQNSNEVNKPSFHASSGDSKIIQNERIDWTKFSPDLKVATHASGFERTNDDISVAVENRRQSSSVRFDSFANKDIEGEMSRWKQGVNRFSLETARTNVPSDSQADASPRSIHKNRNSIRKITNSIVISYGNSKPSVVTNSSRPMSGNQHGDLNNSETSAHGAVAALISNSKSEVVGQSPAFRRRSATTSHRNFVKLRYPYSTSNWRNASNVALNMEVKNGNDISTGIQLRKPTKYFTRTGAKKPVIVNNHVMSKPMKSNHSLSVQESPSQKVGSGNKTGYKYNDTTVQYLKNWPNEALQNMEDLYNYEKYTSSLEEESSHESSLSSAEETPILSSNNYFDHTDPILDSSVKKIIHWLKIPEIVPNNTQYFDYNDDKPIQPDFESVYENLEPNRPLNTHDDNYETIVLQDAPPSQNLDTIDSNYPIRLSDPSSLQYETGSSNPFVPSIPSSWSDGTSLQNKTVYNPTTHVTQNTVVHILNDGLKKPNVTVTELKAPETDEAAANQVASSESSSESLGPSAQRPNVHIMSTSQKDENKNISKQETDTSPSSTYNTNCPTIMINTYTRVNNTLQSKEGCTDLNIIVNSHILNTNVFKPSSTPAIADDHETSLATQSYGTADESEKYSNVPTDLSYVDSVGSYASTGTYDSSLLETSQPGQHDYYDFPKDPNEILDPAQSLGLSTIDSLHTVEVSQGTQISLSLANAEETPSPAGSSVDGPGNDASSSAINPPAAGASASGPSVAGTLGSENPSVPVAQELPVYLVKPGAGQVNDTHRDLKDLQYMDQSLRTVATQLLNVTNPQDMVNVNNKELIKAEHNIATTPKSSENSIPLLMRDVSSEINLEPMHFGRPINSKFSYFESGHPGQAMAMTEEELEREMSTTRLITAYKNHPTTTGGISTWILLNPPSTTVKSVETEKSKTQQPFQTEVRLTVRPSSSIEKETIPQPEKITEKTTPQLTPVITTEKVTVITKKPTTTTTKKIATTSKPEKVTQNSEKTETLSSTTLKVIRTTTTSTSTTSDGTATLTTVLTTKKSQPPRTTSKPKITTPRTTLHSKPATTKPTTTKPMRPKPTRKPTVKPETVKNETSASTGKIEKVTFKPVPIIATPQNKAENTEKPMFVTKIKASVLMDTQKTPITLLPATTATTLSTSTTFKSNLSTVDLVEVPVRSKPVNTKGNNVLRVQLKKPIDETTQIEIEPIKVNAPILTIEKIDKMDEIVMKDTDDLNDSRIDLKFDFNPELTKINVETKTETDAISTSTAASTTTKRPRHNSKRKKNKTRRRKPTTSAPSSTMIPVLIETIDSVTDSTIADNAVQESKIAPETKVGANTTKTKKKQPQKAISTQIYNFLSREVMPSFGVMSLVGLGLGLASYFLYPFGGTITRRNYDVEPNYKYNMDEYGGNYGQSEEEMLSKVFQGMTNVPGYENKYPGTKDNYNNNYYHYQHYDGAYDTQTKKIETRYPSISTSPVYKTVENTQPAVKYRNTDFQYPETQTTPVYYDRKRPDFAAEVGASSAANRQFVVGNVPKEYPFDVKTANLPVDSKKGYMSTEVGQTQFEREVTQNFDFPNAAGLHSYGHLGASTIRADDGYEEIEITPTAVAVEHGPRSLKVKRAALNKEKPSDKDTTHPAGSKDPETIEWFDSSTTKKPSEGFSLINFVKKVAEIKFRLGLTILKHASEGFARYLGHVQKRINGEE
ncbi:hypothetical protein ALC62_04515 [Cyphomyrmex costatus]|uniref:Uncharacterized protein n=1 Tax=Cyphomyrmex costatus TaxID=456900 RepID=A0A195CWJ4_9HYME|nr:hypothetical protein ALC62_04515 [Cyphomyrmex costatus]